MAAAAATAAGAVVPPAGAAENSVIQKALSKYVKRKKLDPLETYVPTVLLAQLQLGDIEKRIGGEAPDFSGSRTLLRSGPTASLRTDIRAVAQYAEEAGGGPAARAAVDQCLSAIEDLDSLLLRGERDGPGASTQLAPLQKCITAASAALDRLLATVPDSILDRGRAVAADYRKTRAGTDNLAGGGGMPPLSLEDEKLLKGLLVLRRKPLDVAARAALGRDDVEYDLQGDVIADDFYSILGLTPDATPEEIKRAYYGCMKTCHPDLTGNHPENVEFCMFVNEVYEVLSDPDMRMVYDEINGYNLTAVNPFVDTRHERNLAFVDEFSCIGCKNCANTAESTFAIESLFGRARVVCQDGDAVPKVQEAIDTCPVNCIHWVSAQQLSLLEDEMRRVERVGMMLAGMGSKGVDVFSQASWRWQRRQSRALDRARVTMMREKRKTQGWHAPWAAPDVPGPDGHAPPSTPGRSQKAAKTAAAARRWREYSRSGADRRPTRVLVDELCTVVDDEEIERLEALSKP
eukprot:SM000056S18009  [mRNA]  locus=s56:633813:641862:+ [translate_table: standard]